MVIAGSCRGEVGCGGRGSHDTDNGADGCDELRDALISQGIDDAAPVSFGPNEAADSEDRQVPGDGRLTCPSHRDEVTNRGGSAQEAEHAREAHLLGQGADNASGPA